MNEQDRVRVTFNNSDQRIDIWMTEQELKRMLTHTDAWESKAWQFDVDKLSRTVTTHGVFIGLAWVAIAMVIFAIGVLFAK